MDELPFQLIKIMNIQRPGEPALEFRHHGEVDIATNLNATMQLPTGMIVNTAGGYTKKQNMAMEFAKAILSHDSTWGAQDLAKYVSELADLILN